LTAIHFTSFSFQELERGTICEGPRKFIKFLHKRFKPAGVNNCHEPASRVCCYLMTWLCKEQKQQLTSNWVGVIEEPSSAIKYYFFKCAENCISENFATYELLGKWSRWSTTSAFLTKGVLERLK